MNDKQEWLDSLKEGDKVAIKSYGFSMYNYRIYEVYKITPTRIIKVGDYEFDKNGRKRGKRSSWERSIYLEPVTQEVLDYIEYEKLLSAINKVEFKKLSLEKLRKIVDVVNV